MTDLRTPRPWERRLKDLSFVLANCAQTYFDPELFRMHTNQFLQTARTVTFIIQKNKGGIPEFEAWYSSEVQENWRMDEVMLWARDARNKIEKVGDLELVQQSSGYFDVLVSRRRRSRLGVRTS